MAKLTTDTLGYAPISNSQSQTRKARHTIPACKCEARQVIPACKAQTSYPNMKSKSHCIKGTARAQNSRIAEIARIVVGVRRALYKEISRVNTTTLKEARQGIRHEAKDCSSKLGTISN